MIDKSKRARMGPSVGRTSRSTRSVTCTSARRTRSSRRRASWSTTGSTLLYRTKSARLSLLPAQGTMLSKGVRPQNPAQHLRGSARRCLGAGQDRGVQAIRPRQETCRDVVCALEAYPAARPAAIARAMRCSVRVHVGSDRTERSAGLPSWSLRPPPFAPCALRKRCKRQ